MPWGRAEPSAGVWGSPPSHNLALRGDLHQRAPRGAEVLRCCAGDLLAGHREGAPEIGREEAGVTEAQLVLGQAAGAVLVRAEAEEEGQLVAAAGSRAARPASGRGWRGPSSRPRRGARPRRSWRPGRARPRCGRDPPRDAERRRPRTRSRAPSPARGSGGAVEPSLPGEDVTRELDRQVLGAPHRRDGPAVEQRGRVLRLEDGGALAGLLGESRIGEVRRGRDRDVVEGAVDEGEGRLGVDVAGDRCSTALPGPWRRAWKARAPGRSTWSRASCS